MKKPMDIPWIVDSVENCSTNEPRYIGLCIYGSHQRTVQNGSSKESNSSWKNANTRGHEDDFPCLVVEAGMSESLSQLHRDASWWIQNSADKVNIVLIIWIRKAIKMLHIEKYVPGPLKTRTGPRLSHPTCANLTTTIVLDCAALPTTVTGAPLVLEFNGIFDRPPNPPPLSL